MHVRYRSNEYIKTITCMHQFKVLQRSLRIEPDARRCNACRVQMYSFGRCRTCVISKCYSGLCASNRMRGAVTAHSRTPSPMTPRPEGLPAARQTGGHLQPRIAAEHSSCKQDMGPGQSVAAIPAVPDSHMDPAHAKGHDHHAPHQIRKSGHHRPTKKRPGNPEALDANITFQSAGPTRYSNGTMTDFRPRPSHRFRRISETMT